MQSLDTATAGTSVDIDNASLVIETLLYGMRTIRSEMRLHCPAGLTVPQFRILKHLNHHGGASLSHMAEQAGLSLPSMSKAIDCLVRHGLVARSTSTSDRRRVMLEMTQQGRDALGVVDSAIRTRVAQMLAELSPDESAQMARGVGILRSVLQKARGRDR